MAKIAVLLIDWEQMCCGERREVGDVITLQVQNLDGTIYEIRHGVSPGTAAHSIRGSITDIRWRPAEMLREGDYAMTVVGYGPGMAVDSTEYHGPVQTGWAFEFTVETDDPIPVAVNR